MVGLILILAVMWFVLGALFWAGSVWFQGYIYNEPSSGLEWRSPAAATALAVFAGFWCWLNLRGYDPRTPDELPYGNIFEFSTTQQQEVGQLTSVKKRRGQAKSEEAAYKARKMGGRKIEFVNAHNQVWKRSDADGYVEAIIVELDGQPVRLDAELTKEGNFPPNQPARFAEAGGQGRYMIEDQLGRVFGFRWGLLLGNLSLNLGYLLVWFLCLWLLLRFQWSHALGLAVVFWMVMTLLILPMLRTQMIKLAQQRATPTATAVPLAAPAAQRQ